MAAVAQAGAALMGLALGGTAVTMIMTNAERFKPMNANVHVITLIARVTDIATSRKLLTSILSSSALETALRMQVLCQP